MGTAVLSPQDCLSSPHSRQNRHFSSIAYRPASVPRSSTARYVASAPASDCARRGSRGGTNLGDGRGLLGRRNASAGLLPLPDRGLQSVHTYPSFYMPSPKALCGGGQSMASYSHPPQKFVSSATLCPPTVGSSTALLRLQSSSVPCRLQSSSVPARRSVSAGLPHHGVQSFARRGLLRERQNSTNGRLAAQCYGVVGSGASVVGEAPVHTQPKSLPSLKFSDVKDMGQKKRAYGADRGCLRKRTHPELSQVEVHVDRHGMKLPFKVLLEGHRVGQKAGVGRHLERSSSEKFQGRNLVTILQRPRDKEAAEDLITRFFQKVVGYASPERSDAGSQRSEEKCGALSSFGKEKIGAFSLPSGSHGKGSDTFSQKICCASNSDVVRMGTPQVAATLKVESIKKYTDAFCQAMGTSCLGVNNDRQFFSKEDQHVSRLDFLASGMADELPLHMGGTQQQINMEFAICKDDKEDTVMGSGEISRCFDAVLGDDRWMFDSERWAGPSFFNSPPPSSLPLPSFTTKLSRAASLETASVIGQHVQVNAEQSSAKSSPISLSLGATSFSEVKGSWDAAFATKDLRRMLNL